MRIGQLAAATGVSVQTVRYYERRGLISAPLRRESGYREYPPAAVDEIRSIRQLKDLGFTLDEIRDALAAHTGDGELCRLAAEKVRAIDDEIRRLSRIKTALEQRRRACGCDRAPRFQIIRR